MKNKQTNTTTKLMLLFAISLMVIGVAIAEVMPSRPTTIVNNGNMTNSYPNGTMVNGTRGYIYNLTITESQPSLKWVGYVGNVIGEYALQDGAANSLYDWNIVTITGEIYATKETTYAGGSAFETINPYNGGIPNWTNVICANSTMINLENDRFNHTATDEDAYVKTFTDSGFANSGVYVGETLVPDAASTSGNCYGLYLNKNNTDQVTHWKELVLTDMTSQDIASDNATKAYDLIYASVLENDTQGFDNNTYDFQMILPQSGLAGNQMNVAFYFYVELI